MPDTITLLGSLAGLDLQAVVGKTVWVRVHYAPDGKLLGGTEPPGTVLGEPGYAPTGYGSTRPLVTDEQGLFGGVLPWEDGGIYAVAVPGDVTRYLMMGTGAGEHPAGSTVNVRLLPGPDEVVTPSVTLDALIGDAVASSIDSKVASGVEDYLTAHPPTTDASVSALIGNPATETAGVLRDGYAPRTLVPATRAQSWGHSFMAGVGPTGAPTATQGMAPQIADALGLPLEQHAVGGTALYHRLSADANWRSVLRDVTRPATPGGDVLGGFYQVMYGMNDIANLGKTTAALLTYRHALRVALSRFRAASFCPHTHESITYGGAGWATTAGVPDASMSLTRNATAGATITIAADLPGGHVVPVFMCWTEAGGGAVFTGSGDAAGYSLDTRTIGRTDTYTVSCLRVPAKKGAGTYTFTTSDIAGANGAIFLGWQWEPPANTGPVIALVKQPKLRDYDGYAASTHQPDDASIDTLNVLHDEVAAEFGQRVVTVNTSVMDKSTTYFVAGNVHPTVAGHAKLADLVAEAVKAAAAFVADPADVIRAAPSAGSPDSPSDTRITWGTAAPTTGTWQRGDVCFNNNAGPNDRSGWICTAAGTPGTWREMQPPRIGSGQSDLVGGSVTVTYSPGITSQTQIRAWHVNVQRGGTPGALYISGKTGTSFTVSSTSATDNSTIQWEILG